MGRRRVRGQWRGPTRTPIGPLGSSPAATIGSHGYDYVFWEGTNRQLWEAADLPTGWTAPIQLGFGPLGSQPTATSWKTSSGVVEIDAFWEGTDGALWRANYETSTGKWTGPSRLGMGPLGSPPTATEQGTSAGAQIQVYWKGTDGALWEADASGGATWSGPTSHGMGPLGSAPAVASLSYGNEDVFWGGTFGRLWQAHWDSTSWNGVNLNGPTSVGFGPMASAPTVAAVAPNEYDVFWVGTDSTLWEAQLVGQTWTTVESRGPMVASPPPAPVRTAPPPPPAIPGRVHARVMLNLILREGLADLLAVRILRLPVHGEVLVRCRGRGCRNARVVIHPSHARRRRVLQRDARLHARRILERLFHGRWLRAGDRLIFTLTAPGLGPERLEFVIHRNRVAWHYL